MSFKIETIASAVAIVLSIGTIFYHVIIMKRNVEILSLQSEKKHQMIEIVKNKTQINEKEIELIKSELKFNNDRVKEINSKITEVQNSILKSSQETRHLLIKALEDKLK